MEDFNTSKQLYTLRKKAFKRDESYDQNIGQNIIFDIAVEFDEESLKNYESNMESSGEYNYDGSIDREANGIEEFAEINPTEIHHFLTNKRLSEGKYVGISQEFNSIVQRYGLDLDGEWNKGEVPFHRGTHAVEYHDFMLKELKNIDNLAKGDKNRFLELFSSLKSEISRNPELLYVRGWIENYSKERYGIIE